MATGSYFTGCAVWAFKDWVHDVVGSTAIPRYGKTNFD